ncbi:cellobiose phosphotransferase system IIB component [Lacticaseibacillus zeae DSM 20178 = KCTC 3804]|uniref:Cellobiose phosphotransferase system IIB component n=1 Tax=Lacticaseibacillus zeae DSM 20178 = KCTC 3804 TaxID=1423816 RepID=A0A0R1EU19_LACZE|nr:cellobiose phosphotransferase system IIB component [Lacticaseibacillus zeae DSM 20178 = KCTC 3804]
MAVGSVIAGRQVGKEDCIVKKALIICAAGMSSSMMAKKTTDYFKAHSKDIQLDAVTATEGEDEIRNGDFDLFLISPQTNMYLDNFQKVGKEVGKPVVSIPFDAYIPIPMGIEKMAKLVEKNL